jgi:cytidylate kinase
MWLPHVITIDGPAGAGKSTLGELLARRIGYLYFDTGVMYRALTLQALRDGYNLHDAAALEQLAHAIRIDVVPPTVDDDRQYTVLVNGNDVTWELRSPEVDRHVSLVSSYPGVRAELIRRQREIGLRGQVVMVGRDIGTRVMPDAPLKIYLQASLEARARRRLHDQQRQGLAPTLEQVQAEVARRDALDQHVMAPASDALVLSSDNITPENEVDWILAQVQRDTTP